MTGPHGSLNWRNAAHWGGGRHLPCIHCRRGAFCRDDHGRPCHKTCAEAVSASRAEQAAHDLTEGAA
ncbi:hypothetical protein [Spirillospora sp. NPDC029432]|uniref:hypothetical protein n=1 Tax=Spirillospora sp. NPDC029432 TaxID=3154599 RepID=UPI0034542074